MAADNVKIAFRLPGGVNEDFIRNLIWQPQQQHQENNQQQQNNQFTEGVSKYIQEKPVLKSLLIIKFQVFSLQLYHKRDSDAGIFLSNYEEHVFCRTHRDDYFTKNGFTKNGPNSNC